MHHNQAIKLTRISTLRFWGGFATLPQKLRSATRAIYSGVMSAVRK